jgi:AraC-like DNA-binding protein
LFGVLEDEPPAAAPTGPVEEWRGILDQLRGHMGTRRPWLDPDLTLEQLALQLKLRPKLLSQAINEGLGQNFFEFINRYRIEEARRLLTNPADKKITVLEVLYQVGFNSKSSFNTVFKKQTGLTPSEFKKKMTG